jgi:hypothetical protein
MKKLFGGLSGMFAAFGSAGQYGLSNELEYTDEESKEAQSKVATLPVTPRTSKPKRLEGVQLNSFSSDPAYFTGSMLVKKRLG